jgi:predicted deacylase
MRHRPFRLNSVEVPPGKRRQIDLKVSETYTALPVCVPVTVINGTEPGPAMFVCAAIHGDELNGLGIVRRLAYEIRFRKLHGTLVLIPVMNPFGFQSLSRELPDGRDLNRHFSGKYRGTMPTLLARRIFSRVIQMCDCGIDIHTAPQGKTNITHIRADMTNPMATRMAKAFGTNLIFDFPGNANSLRCVACGAGVPTITLETGEPLKFQRAHIQRGVRGVFNVMATLGMVEAKPKRPAYQMVVKQSGWLRAERGGILMLTVRPGQTVNSGQRLAQITKPFGREVCAVKAPFNGLVVSATTIPVNPGSAICHILKLGPKRLQLVKNALAKDKH